MRTKIAAGFIVLALIALVSGATMQAVAAPGSQDDPFITLDYLNNKFKPELLNEARGIGQEIAKDIDEKIVELETRLKNGQSSAAPMPADSERFVVVTLSNRQSLTCSVGTEIMLRIGAANGFGSSPALVNYTSGETLSAGAALITNNMYLITIEGNGIRATSDMTRVLVRGDYTLS